VVPFSRSSLYNSSSTIKILVTDKNYPSKFGNFFYGVDTQNKNSVAWDYFFAQITVTVEVQVTGDFPLRDSIRQLLQLQDLEVYTVAFVWDYEIGI
jgi:hypothetical protein